MKKYLILTAFIMLAHTAFCRTAIQTIKPGFFFQKDSLNDYTGDYQTTAGSPITYATVTIINGKLTAKSSTGTVLTLDHLSGDNFNIAQQGVAVKFLRDAIHKITRIAINGKVMWTKVLGDKPAQGVIKPAVPADYLGKYQITMNGQQLYLEVSLKNGQLWCTQLWDGAGSPIDYLSDNDFNVRNLSIPIKFKRDKDKTITQLVLNNTDVFTRVKN